MATVSATINGKRGAGGCAAQHVTRIGRLEVSRDERNSLWAAIQFRNISG